MLRIPWKRDSTRDLYDLYELIELAQEGRIFEELPEAEEPDPEYRARPSTPPTTDQNRYHE